MAVPRSRILDLMKASDSLRMKMIIVNATQAQCRIFSTTFNPEGTRTGNKVLRQRLKGPALAAYYPRRTATLRDLRNAYPDLETWDEDEEDRLEHLRILKQKGKSAPKKKRTAEESKKFATRKKKPAAGPVKPA